MIGKNNDSAENRASSGKIKPQLANRPLRPSAGQTESSPPVAKTSSFAPLPPPSSATIELHDARNESPLYRQFLLCFAAVFVLVLLGGSGSGLSVGLALSFSGLALVRSGPLYSMGRWLDRSALALLVVLFGSFLPVALVGTDAWRSLAVELHGLKLGWLVSIQPRVSLEAWLMVLAGLAWFYTATCFPLNYAGRRRLMLVVCLMISFLAACVVFGNLASLQYPGASSSGSFSFFPTGEQTACFLAMGGVVAFGYLVEGLRTRDLIHLAGLLGTVLSLGAILASDSFQGLVLYFAGLFAWFLIRLLRARLLLSVKIGSALVLPVCLLASVDLQDLKLALVEAFRPVIQPEMIAMFKAAPVLGQGLGTYPVLASQFRNLPVESSDAIYSQSDLGWLLAEGGTLSILFLTLFVVGYFGLIRKGRLGLSTTARTTSLVAVLVFCLHCVLDASGRHVGVVYYALLFAALAIPRQGESQRPLLAPKIQRGLGLIMILIGLFWALGWLLHFPLYSKDIERLERSRANQALESGVLVDAVDAVDRWIAISPMDWRAYLLRGQIWLEDTANLGDAAKEFSRARFVEPRSREVLLQEADIWLAHDEDRAVAAWQEALSLKVPGQLPVFESLLELVQVRPTLMSGIIEISKLNPDYRAMLLLSLQKEEFMSQLKLDLEKDPSLSRFSMRQRTALLQHWISIGDNVSAEAFLDSHIDSVLRPWWLRSQLRENEVRFEEALALIRDNLSAPLLPEVAFEKINVESLKRLFMTTSPEPLRGATLIRFYLDQEEYAEALKVVERLLELTDPPPFAYYWKAEIFARTGDIIDSWYLFEAYLNK